MRTALLASCLLGFSLLSSAPADAGIIPSASSSAAIGTLHASAGTSFPCAWSVDGATAGVSTELDVPMFPGEHVLACKRLADGAISTQDVTIAPKQTTVVIAALPEMQGEIIGVSTSGSCAALSLNDGPSAKQLHLWVTPGEHRVACTAKNGARKTRSIVVRSGETAVAIFE